jgi:hypothetical protein
MHCELCIKNITFAPQNQALMSKHNLQIEEKILKIALKAKSLTYIAISPCWRFEIIPESNLQESYLTNFHKVCHHALRYRIVIT